MILNILAWLGMVLSYLRPIGWVRGLTVGCFLITSASAEQQCAQYRFNHGIIRGYFYVICVHAVRKPDMDALCKYVAGYNECAAQVTQYLTSLQTNTDGSTTGSRDSLTDDARCSLLDHLANSLHQPATAAAGVSSQDNLSHVTPQSSVHQSSSSSLSPPAVYVISPQQVPVTSSSSPSQLRLLPATLSSGHQLLLLLAGSSSGCPSEDNKTAKLENCDVITLESSSAVSDCNGNQVLEDYKTEKHDVSSQVESSPAVRDNQQNTDLHMWRPW